MAIILVLSLGSHIVLTDDYCQGYNGSEDVPETTNIKEFTKAYANAAIKVGTEYGIPPIAIVAQAAIESGFGQSDLTKEAFNFFGIKADGSDWNGAVWYGPTKEYINGRYVHDPDAAFRKYKNAEDGFRGYGDFIVSNSRYKPALKYPDDPVQYIQEVAKAGYATAEDYASANITMQAQVRDNMPTNASTYEEHSSATKAEPNFKGLGLDKEQQKMVSIIYKLGSRRGLSDRDITIALMAAKQESGWHNLNYGMGTSVGLFQLIDIHGSKATRMNPKFSTNWFYDGLEKIANRESMSTGQVAQAVQGSDYPDEYVKHEKISQKVLNRLSNGASTQGEYPSYDESLCGSSFQASGEWQSPLEGDIDLSSRCGMRTHPVSGEYKLHDGADLDADIGNPVYATNSGEVKESGSQPAWGNTVVLDHGGGITSRVAHLSSIASDIVPGVSVDKGELLGRAGNTGWSTGPHLHFSIYLEGKALQPLEFIKTDGRTREPCA